MQKFLRGEKQSMSEILSVRDLRKSFGGRAVLNIGRLQLAAGECAIVSGDNGGGKTTLLRILAGLLRPESVGEWRFCGRPQTPQTCGISGASLLHQTPHIFSGAVADNIAFACNGDRQRTAEAMEWAGLSSLAADTAATLSGGMRQRLSLARMRAARPKLCLLDEPEAHLDESGRRLVADLVASALSQNAAVLIAAPPTAAPDIPNATRRRLMQGDLLPGDN